MLTSIGGTRGGSGARWGTEPGGDCTTYVGPQAADTTTETATS